METRLPYYMAYPTTLQYNNEMMERRDLEYMKSMYPMAVKRILPLVEEECERMSYKGSMIYDEYPDQLQIYLMCGRICDRIQKQRPKNDLEMELEIRKDSGWLEELVQMLVFQELHRRRCEQRKKFYY